MNGPDVATGLRFVFAASYWQPYRSGLTLSVGRVAEELARRGARVTAVTSYHDRSLPPDEVVNGVRVLRQPVWLRLKRAALAPTIVSAFWTAVRDADAAVIVLPIAEAPALARLAPRERTAAYYVCDPDLRAGALGRAAIAFADYGSRRVVARSAMVVANSAEYAAHSRVLASVAERVRAIEPPIQTERLRRVSPSRFDARLAPPPSLRVGFLGRLVFEKGLNHLVAAVAAIPGPVQLVLAGPSDAVAGEGLSGTLARQARDLGVDALFLGPLDEAELADFYSALDVFALPSVNRLEAWGMAQVEAMLCGTPVVASELPGVRLAVQRTGMGLLTPPGNVRALTAALIQVAGARASFVRDRDAVIAALGLDTTLDRHVAALTALARAPSR